MHRTSSQHETASSATSLPCGRHVRVGRRATVAAKAAMLGPTSIVTAVALLLAAGPGLAAGSVEGVASHAEASSSQTLHGGVELQASTSPVALQASTSPVALHRVDFRQVGSPATSATSPLSPDVLAKLRDDDAGRDRAVATGIDRRSVSSAGTIAEPASIAVFGFALAALLAIRRRKQAATEASDTPA